jgi:S-DNA-T family DNA segregation ATPase FtsK/SpoIIIE
MLRRYKLLESYSSRNIMNYNRKIKKLEQHNMDSDEKLDYIVLIIDEFADLMMIAKKEVEESISRLAAMARAVGIHLILATQRPSTDIITGTIKSNFPARIGFMVSSYYDSKTILDNPGAEKLLGKGDMLFFTPGMGSPERIQGTYVSEEEIIKMMDNLKKLGKPNYIECIFDEDDDNSSADYEEDFDEPLWEEAINIVINDKKASASYLQRKLKIGYNRAARIVEHMEYEGIVGPEQGSKPRDVLIDEY